MASKHDTFRYVFSEWFRENKHHSNSMFTTKDLEFEQGRAQLKWWRYNARLIVKTVELHPQYRGQLFFTRECQAILKEYAEIQTILLESVLEPELLQALERKGWQRENDGYNLLLDKSVD